MATKVEKDLLSGVETTGHDWDGIKELNNPLPKWWVYVFYATIVWSVVYWVLMPAWPIPFGQSYTHGILGFSKRVELEKELATPDPKRADFKARIDKASFAEIEKTDDLRNFAITGGRVAFNENCAPCHGAGGQGQPGKGFPNLADDDWIWGGKAEEIQFTVTHGIRNTTDPEARSGLMPAWGSQGLSKDQINDAVEFVLSLNKRSADAAAAKKGAAVFAENCAACHGEKGEGNRDVGAKRLNDDIWNYGGDKPSLIKTVTYGRGGIMPNWGTRLDKTTIKELTVYVHTLGGGEK